MTTITRSWPAVLTLLSGLVLAGCQSDDPADDANLGSTRPSRAATSVLLVTLDTLRADRLGCYGNESIQTPHLDRFAEEGFLFEQAFSPVPSTLPAHCSIMTGLYPAEHGVHDNGVYVLAQESVTLAERLLETGSSTAAFVSAYVLDAKFQLDQGFTTYDDEVDMPLTDGDPSKIGAETPDVQRELFAKFFTAYQRRAQSVTERAIEWLESRGDRPYFLWVHYFDAHAPYAAPGEWETYYDPEYDGLMDGEPKTFFARTNPRNPASMRRDIDHMIARYDGEISYLDEWFGRLMQTVRDTGRWDETLIAVVGDHGESFGERRGGQIWEHNSEVFDQVVRVPFILRIPGLENPGRKLPGLVRTIDVAPTIYDWLGMDHTDGMTGSSLLPVIRGEREAPGEVLLQALRELQVHDQGMSLLGYRNEEMKVIVQLDPNDQVQRTMAFQLDEDPGEIEPVQESTAIGRQRDRILSQNESMKKSAVTEIRTLSEEELEALRNLGYVDDGQ